VLDETIPDFSRVDLAMDAGGNAVAAWREWARDDDDQTGEGVWAAGLIGTRDGKTPCFSVKPAIARASH